MDARVANCKKCNKVFQQFRQPYCTDCAKVEDEKFSVLYRILQNSAVKGGISIDALSAETEIPVEDIEKYFVEGRFGTATPYLQIFCQECGIRCTTIQRLGRYCIACNELTAAKAKVTVKSLHALNKLQSEAETLEQQAELLRVNQAKRAYYGKFGHAVK